MSICMSIREPQLVFCRDEDPTFFSTDPDPAGEKVEIRILLVKNTDPDPTFNRMKKKYIHILGR